MHHPPDSSADSRRDQQAVSGDRIGHLDGAYPPWLPPAVTRLPMVSSFIRQQRERDGVGRGVVAGNERGMFPSGEPARLAGFSLERPAR